MSRTLEDSGGSDHVSLVKLATKKVVDVLEGLQKISVTYEEEDMNLEIKIDDGTRYGPNTTLTFRPDIIVQAASKSLRRYENAWSSILDSRKIIVEAETNPKNIFANVVKMEAYKQFKKMRSEYAFVLVCYHNADVPNDIEPFDEVWKFDKLIE